MINVGIIKKCDHCAGQKRLLAMGGMYKDCHYCKGIGYQEIKDNMVNTNDVNKLMSQSSAPRVTIGDAIKDKQNESQDNVNQPVIKVKRKYRQRFIKPNQLNV